MDLKKNNLVPGKWVSVYHFQSTLPGWLYNLKGRTDDKYMFHGGCIFANHASGYIQARHQVTFSANETVKAEFQYERDAANYGVCIQAYHIDNGVFNSKDFMDELIAKYQHIRFSGEGAAHQNNVSKCIIQTVNQMAHTMLIHSTMRIPQGTITADLWLMAINHTVGLYNKMTREDSCMSTYEL